MTGTATSRLSVIGRSPAVTCAPTASIAQVARQMAENEIGAVVVAEEGLPVGIVTDRDLVVRGIAMAHEPTDRVSLVMTSEVVSIVDAASTFDAARQMATHKCRRLAVLNDEGRVIAVVSADDILRVDADVHAELDRLISYERRH